MLQVEKSLTYFEPKLHVDFEPVAEAVPPEYPEEIQYASHADWLLSAFARKLPST